MSAPRFRTRLAGQLLAMFVPWSLFVVACLLVGFSGRVEDYQRGRDLQATRILAAECAPLAHSNDMVSLNNLVATHLEALPGLRYVLVLEATGDLVWSTFTEGTPSGLLVLRRESSQSATRVRLAGELIDDYQAARSGLLVRAGYSVQPARDLALGMLPVLVATGLAGLALIFILASYLSRPVEALSLAVTSAAEGQLSQEFRAISETSEIAERFDVVVDRLEEKDRQLEAARRLAQLGEVSASIPHDVNNPLGVVVLNAELLSRRLDAGQLPEASHKEVRRLWIAARRATLMVQRFLQIARWSTRPSRAIQRLVDVPALVDETVELLEERARKAKVEIEVHAPDDLEQVLCDEQGLMQVAMNLIANAVDASPVGEVVDVGIDIEGPSLVLTVADRGPGMSDDVAARATEPFFTTKEKGSGLGLAICDKIIRSHGGTLSHTAREPGTCFRVELPHGREHA